MLRFDKIYLVFLISLFASTITAQDKKNKPETLRPIILDYEVEKGQMNFMFRECIGAGRANEGLRADWQEQLKYVKEQCGFKYIRMHGLLTDDMGVYFEDKAGNPVYNWHYIDILYDFLLSIKMKPFVEIGFMPKALASDTKTIFWWNGNVTPPKDYKMWHDLIYNLVLHFTERYGEEEVKTWYFEVWNEPNLSGFWAGTQDEYFKLYEYSVKAIKSINKDFKVGGPATAGAAWVPEMIDFCSRNSLLIDFISTHSYGVKQGFLDEFGSTGTILDKNAWSVSGDIINSRKQIQASSMPALELHYTEWSSSYTPADPIHDSYHQAAYILEKIKQADNNVNSMSYWVFTDIFEEAGPRVTPFHGGFGLINYQAINKPAFYAYQFLNRLGSTELDNPDKASWACKNANGDIQVLYWDFTNTHPGDSVNNQVYYKRDLPSKSKGMVKLEIANIRSGKYALGIYKVGYRNNDAYTAYLDLGSPNQLTKDQVNVIKKLTDGSQVINEIIDIKAGSSFVRELPLRENDVFLVILKKI